TPLGEAGPERLVLGEALAQAVEPLGGDLAGGARQGLGPPVHLDARDDPLAGEDLREGRAVVGALPDGLVEQDHAADELRRARSREEHLAVGAAGLGGALDPEGLEALLDAGVAL